mmetsp:Transcript_6521/g.26571  ORF Transcript_6521/g.26571 Transcript_6521/m.26571 type:complete len:616 (-) Transcript_6521:558-2405(-)
MWCGMDDIASTEQPAGSTASLTGPRLHTCSLSCALRPDLSTTTWSPAFGTTRWQPLERARCCHCSRVVRCAAPAPRASARSCGSLLATGVASSLGRSSARAWASGASCVARSSAASMSARLFGISWPSPRWVSSIATRTAGTAAASSAAERARDTSCSATAARASWLAGTIQKGYSARRPSRTERMRSRGHIESASFGDVARSPHPASHARGPDAAAAHAAALMCVALEGRAGGNAAMASAMRRSPEARSAFSSARSSHPCALAAEAAAPAVPFPEASPLPHARPYSYHRYKSLSPLPRPPLLPVKGSCTTTADVGPPPPRLRYARPVESQPSTVQSLASCKLVPQDLRCAASSARMACSGAGDGRAPSPSPSPSLSFLLLAVSLLLGGLPTDSASLARAVRASVSAVLFASAYALNPGASASTLTMCASSSRRRCTPILQYGSTSRSCAAASKASSASEAVAMVAGSDIPCNSARSGAFAGASARRSLSGHASARIPDPRATARCDTSGAAAACDALPAPVRNVPAAALSSPRTSDRCTSPSTSSAASRTCSAPEASSIRPAPSPPSSAPCVVGPSSKAACRSLSEKGRMPSACEYWCMKSQIRTTSACIDACM